MDVVHQSIPADFEDALADNPQPEVRVLDTLAASRIVLCLLVSAVLCAEPALTAQVTAKQGTQDPTEFTGSMILEAPFPPPVPAGKTGQWFSAPDYSRMRLYRCDRIYITFFQFKIGAEKNGVLPISARIWLANPDGNHDKNVELILEVLHGDQKVTEARRSIKVEESDVAKREIDLPVKAADLKADPSTLLRITVRTKDI